MIHLLKSGGLLMLPLVLCSFVSLTLIIERSIFWLRIRRDKDRDLVYRVLDLADQGLWDEIRLAARGSRNFIIRILINGILHRDYSMAMAMESAASDELRKMRRFMGVLETIITVAPLLGILGTVVGIIHSFDMLGAKGIGDPQAVTGGIAQALITTAAGLSISILTLLPCNYFNACAEASALAIEKYATSLEITYEKRANGNRDVQHPEEGKLAAGGRG
ncbi:MotA/TolQ/ExbB proton channel family protein [Desulfoluna butyratoxydans]|uniref:Mota/tolq/exbb proton channel n=1 Tax=Desulfoluna butyratoxydans TaxID=231438 RepID=A0A4V6ILZ6_9BACT|nr:MotA/TolQ/ExbB proton channel family protein [Desulfoluna butyratoxydans]VFQ46788.1 mota/tolq/exbb proton channel [Desulfoluna butyratoxydans]